MSDREDSVRLHHMLDYARDAVNLAYGVNFPVNECASRNRMMLYRI